MKQEDKADFGLLAAPAESKLQALIALRHKPNSDLPVAICRKPVRREELNARIELHTAMKTDAAWLKSLMNGSTSQDTEAMQLLQAIMPQKIIAKIQVQCTAHMYRTRAVWTLCLQQVVDCRCIAVRISDVTMPGAAFWMLAAPVWLQSTLLPKSADS